MASVSCIYGLGSPQEYNQITLRLRVGDEPGLTRVTRRLVGMYYDRNMMDLAARDVQGAWRFTGDHAG